MKEELKEVKKVWGKEVWIINCPEYCGKLLYLDKGAVSSYHRHLKKKETFFVLQGVITLTVEGKDCILNPYSSPKTILPEQLHSFAGITSALIIEFSTHDSPEDTVRLTESRTANP